MISIILYSRSQFMSFNWNRRIKVFQNCFKLKLTTKTQINPTSFKTMYMNYIQCILPPLYLWLERNLKYLICQKEC